MTRKSEQQPLMERMVIFVILFPITITSREAWKWLLTGELPEREDKKEYGIYAS